jgi:hypothetical protein
MAVGARGVAGPRVSAISPDLALATHSSATIAMHKAAAAPARAATLRRLPLGATPGITISDSSTEGMANGGGTTPGAGGSGATAVTKAARLEGGAVTEGSGITDVANGSGIVGPAASTFGADGGSGRRIFRIEGGFAAAIRGSDRGFAGVAAGIRELEVDRGGTASAGGNAGFETEGIPGSEGAAGVDGRPSSNVAGGIELGTACTSASIPSGTFIPLSGPGSVSDGLESALLSWVDMGLINDNEPLVVSALSACAPSI